MCIEEQAINYWWSGWVYYSYLYQPDKIHYVLYYTKYEQGSLRPSPATCEGRATGIISEIWYLYLYNCTGTRTTQYLYICTIVQVWGLHDISIFVQLYRYKNYSISLYLYNCTGARTTQYLYICTIVQVQGLSDISIFSIFVLILYRCKDYAISLYLFNCAGARTTRYLYICTNIVQVQGICDIFIFVLIMYRCEYYAISLYLY